MRSSIKNPTQQTSRDTRGGRRYVAGIALTVLGVLALLATAFQSAFIGETIVLALGLTFVAWGILDHVYGLMIPGGILTGVGAGVVLSQSVFPGASGEARGGIVTLCLGLGFLLIMPLQLLFAKRDRFTWWPAIPGGVLTVVGLGLLLGDFGLTALTWLGAWWPVALILLGLTMIYRVARRPQAPSATIPEPMTYESITAPPSGLMRTMDLPASPEPSVPEPPAREPELAQSGRAPLT